MNKQNQRVEADTTVSAVNTVKSFPKIYTPALSLAIQMLEHNEHLEIRSALKEAGSQYSIEWGDAMESFVLWAEDLINV